MFKKIVISVLASGILVGSCFAETHISGKQSIANSYAFDHQGVADVKSTLNASMLYMFLLALHTKVPEIETTAYHAMVLSFLHQIACNTRPSSRPSIEKRYLALPAKKQIALAQKAKKEALDRSIINPNSATAYNYLLWQLAMSPNDSMQATKDYVGTFLTDRLLGGVKVDSALYWKVFKFAQTCTGTVLAYGHRSFDLTSKELWRISKDRNLMVTIDDKVSSCHDAGNALEAKLNAIKIERYFAELGFGKKISIDSKTPPKDKLLQIDVPEFTGGIGSIQQFTHSRNASNSGISAEQDALNKWSDSEHKPSKFIQSTNNQLLSKEGAMVRESNKQEK